MVSLLLILFCQTEVQSNYNHVVLISIDGLRSDALLVQHSIKFKNIKRILSGASTLNARTDNIYTETLPNHTGMLTSRLSNGDNKHGWHENTTPPQDAKLKMKSVFSVTHAANIFSSLNASKEKFVLFRQSWGKEISDYLVEKDGQKQLNHLIKNFDKEKDKKSFHFLHLMDPDVAGHMYGWDLSTNSQYLKSIFEVDTLIGQLFQYLETIPDVMQKTAIVLTSDHGGGAPFRNHHGIGHVWVNYIIPFAVWTGDGAAKGELIELNKDIFQDPGIRDPTPNKDIKPVLRNADAGNLCLQLLGLPPIPKSTRNFEQNLRIKPIKSIKSE